ncbi:hypothetical protein ACQ4PT_045562 [Festuca glaucescens]
MAPPKRRRKNACTAVVEASASPVVCTLPADLLLEIVARSDASALIRCAAAGKLLRRDILNPPFIRRVTGRQQGIVPRCLVAYVRTHNKGKEEAPPPPPPLSLVSPATPAAASFVDHHLSPFMSRNAAEYEPVTSRGGLVLLHRRRDINICRWPGRLPDCLCVYDPLTGERTFLSGPPDISKIWLFLTYVLLNATDDGIGCAFKLLVVQVDHYQHTKCSIKVQAATSTNAGGSSWGPVIYHRDIDLPSGTIQDKRHTVLLRGGDINLYWLTWHDEILTYDINAGKLDTVKLPSTSSDSEASQRRLQASPDGRLWFIVADGFMISVWLLQLQGGGWTWTREAVIDAKENLRLLVPQIPLGHVEIKFKDIIRGERSSVVMLRICHCVLIVLGLETKKMPKKKQEEDRRTEVMEYEYQYSSSFNKEKRPPAKRGQVKMQIARALSNLVSPSTAAAADGSKQANRNSLRRETSYN